jgi:putative transposase
MNEKSVGGERKNRQSIRLPEYDYSQTGAYFVTVLTYQRECILGDVIDDEVSLSEIGKIVEAVWREIPAHFPNVSSDEYVIMPNHVHGIIRIESDIVRARHASPLRVHANKSSPKGTDSRSLGAIIGSFKSAVTKRIHLLQGFQNIHLWHRNYYEHVIRNVRDYERVLDYIQSNPINWEQDSEYPF